METDNLDALRYPIGHFEVPDVISEALIKEWIEQLEQLPARLNTLVKNLSEAQLDTPYRPGGWTVRQTVHHVADSHHNSYTRFKWALTEDTPLIKAYDEKGWAKLFDTRTAPIDLSVAHLSAVHAKLVYLLKGLSREELQRSFLHPEGNTKSALDENIGRYVWHGNHHFQHIQNLILREGWM